MSELQSRKNESTGEEWKTSYLHIGKRGQEVKTASTTRRPYPGNFSLTNQVKKEEVTGIASGSFLQGNLR